MLAAWICSSIWRWIRWIIMRLVWMGMGFESGE